MDNSGAPDDEANAGAAREVAVGLSGVGSGLFVAEGDEADSIVYAGFRNFDDGDADYAKEDVDFEGSEGFGNEVGSCSRRHRYDASVEG